ncbi:MAG: hypothetical protein HN348_22715, partial [Proteobacteria bacterium]|nr:hypothetical protein [Pseudomonadota bacterium]
YRKVGREDLAENFKIDGCSNAWFTPGEKNATGVPCIVAHTQIGLSGIRAEAGLTAFKQLLLKNGVTPTFRPGAAVNVIFVSDTHDPGFFKPLEGYEELTEYRPDFKELQTLVNAHPISSFRVHAVAPKTECSERWEDKIGPAYFDVAEASGGQIRDICTETDYSEFISTIAHDGAIIQRPIFPLGKSAAEVLTVEVGGKPVKWSLASQNGVIVIDDEVGDSPEMVDVVYSYGALGQQPKPRKKVPLTGQPQQQAEPEATKPPAAPLLENPKSPMPSHAPQKGR